MLNVTRHCEGSGLEKDTLIHTHPNQVDVLHVSIIHGLRTMDYRVAITVEGVTVINTQTHYP